MEGDLVELYQLTKKSDKGKNLVPIPVSSLTREMLEQIKPNYIYTINAFCKRKGINDIPVVYFRKVKRFKKDIVEFNFQENIILGV